MQSPTNRRSVRAAFTLIEVIVAIAIVAMLASLVAPNILRQASGAKVNAAKAQIEMLSLALESFHLDYDRYPTTAEGLDALRVAVADDPGRLWNGPYLKRSIPADPWGQAYQYRYPRPDDSTAFALYSFGRDRKLGGTGEDADVGILPLEVEQ